MEVAFEFIVQKTHADYIGILGRLSLRHMGEIWTHWNILKNSMKKVELQNNKIINT
jgi:hypothetical protein